MRARGQTIAALLAVAVRNAGDGAPDDSSLLECTDLLMKSGSGPLAWWATRATSSRASAIHGVLRDAYLHQVGRSLTVAPDLGRLWSRLADARIEAFIAKGPVIADVYPQPALRPFGDFDVYVRPEVHARARDVLDGVRLHRHQVDLHAGPSYLDDVGFDGVCATARVRRVAGIEVLAPGEELHLRLVALHALSEGVMRPLWLCDVAILTLRRSAVFDWRVFLGSDQWRARWASVAIVLAWAVFKLPEETLPAELRDVKLPAWAVPSVMHTWGRDAGIKGARRPMASTLGGREAWSELRRRWPTPFEAVSGVRGRVPSRWPISVQLQECVRRLHAAGITSQRPHS